MTIRFEIPLTAEDPNERFVVAISRNGEMSFPGYEERLEYDVAFQAMGGDPSKPLVFLKRWGTPAGRAGMIQSYFCLNRKTVRRVAADWVAHIAECYNNFVPCTDRRFMRALTCLYQSIESDIIQKRSDAALYEAQVLVGDMEFTARASSGHAISMAQDALFQAAEWYIDLSIIKLSCAMARAWMVSSDDSSIEWHEASILEEEWQTRRFHDLVEAMQQGKKWPPLGATP